MSTREDEKNYKNHFNKHEISKIDELSKENPYLALELYDDYFLKYPDDYSGRTHYIHLLMTINEFEKAEEEINKLEAEINNDNTFLKYDDRIKNVGQNLRYNKVKLYLYQNREEDLLKIYYDNNEDLSFLGNEINALVAKIQGKTKTSEREHKPYMTRQIIEYQEIDFRDHIKKHLAYYNENNRLISTSFFSFDFPIDKVIEEVKKYIPSDKKLCLGLFENAYFFKYDECGRDKNKLVDYFRVTTFNDSSNMITMFPSSGCEKLPYIDLNYLKEKEEDKPKVKVLSQIEKFNKRYNR